MTPFSTTEFGVPGNKTRVSRIGLGTMGMSISYGDIPNDETVKVLNRAIDNGCTFWDTANIYGFGHNERLLSRILKDRRSEIFLCTKFGVIVNKSEPNFKGSFTQHINGASGKPEYARNCVEESLARLGVDSIDLYHMHHMDSTTPIEETVAAMAELVKEGKVRYLGLSNCSADALRRAYKIHPIAAVQVEYSAWNTSIVTNGLLDACRELDITVVAYCPLGSVALTGTLASIGSLPDYDIRRYHSQFKDQTLKSASNLVEAFGEITKRHECTPSQVALAWLLTHDNVIPIPGTKRINYLGENYGAAQIRLSKEVLAVLKLNVKENSVN
ncbi:hypothetical protein IW140_006022 [Coemansia sp. RSA 1813]|nr:hypothetical protein EV178_002395 [Coemansia sp. RSA 1646]KAJ1769582.1 hypothetical protein LPJ74_003944 [Coemansia sp. RSA 1843]KAJ2086000.1 hypothetical protein IW138_005986 [Coemansia sp. RSA 986]KAJ2215021.1 hypothetical protein EV179_002551 [Coemansia sp. RSA 487]KAJ2563651.1 hypothetical protein IW140_006022 [Coemansia sp. RSA 1813]